MHGKLEESRVHRR